MGECLLECSSAHYYRYPRSFAWLQTQVSPAHPHISCWVFLCDAYLDYVARVCAFSSKFIADVSWQTLEKKFATKRFEQVLLSKQQLNLAIVLIHTQTLKTGSQACESLDVTSLNHSDDVYLSVRRSIRGVMTTGMLLYLDRRD